MQSQNLTLPQAASEAPAISGASAGQPAGKIHFGDFLDEAMKNDSSPTQAKLPQTSASQDARQPQPSRKSPHAAINPHTPAVPVAAANSISNGPPAIAQDQSSGNNDVLPNRAQGSSGGIRMLAARQFQPARAEIQHAEEKITLPAKAAAEPELPIHEGQSSNNLPPGRKGLAKNSEVAPLAAHPSEQEFRSTGAQSLLSPANQTSLNPKDLLIALESPVKEAMEPAEANGLISRTSEVPNPTDAVLPTQPLAQNSSEALAFQASDKHLQRALDEMENLQLNFFSATTSQAGGPLPDSPEAAKTFTPHKINGRLSPESANGVLLKHAEASLQKSVKDNGGANTSTAQDGGNTLLPGTPAGGSSGNSFKDGKSDQNSSARHFEVSGSPGSGTGSVSSSLGSVAASPTAALANGLSPAPSQVAPANSAPASSGPLPQAPAAHAATAEKLTSAVDTHLNPPGGMVNSAAMIQAQGKTEMRVALQTDNLGPVELHAVLDAGRVGASISVVSHDAHTLLTNNLPALQQALSDQNLRLDHLSVLNVPMSSGTNTGNGGGFHSGAHTQARPNALRSAFARPLHATPASKESPVTERLRGRLSVHA